MVYTWYIHQQPPPPPIHPLSDSTQSQKSKSEVGLRNGTRQCALGPILGPTLYLWCLGSNEPELVIAESKLVLH